MKDGSIFVDEPCNLNGKAAQKNPKSDRTLIFRNPTRAAVLDNVSEDRGSGRRLRSGVL
jgi:hypothetical protein